VQALDSELAHDGRRLPPLAGMRVLDLSRALSGPFCTMILADLGADVIKIEPLPNGDMIRAWGPFDRGESVYYLSTNRGKRSVGVNFHAPEGLKLLRELALGCDVVVDNFKPGSMTEMGLDPDQLRSEKPELIVASISAFGGGGPLGDQPGFDQIAQGYSGFMSFTGDPATGATRIGVAIGDLAAGLWLSIGVLAAWIDCKAHGRGQQVTTSLFESLASLLSVQGQRFLSLGEVAGPSGNVHPVISPYGVFRTKDRSLNIAAATQEMWLRLCDVLDVPSLKADPRFADNAQRVQHRQLLHDQLEAQLQARPCEDWIRVLVAAGIPAGPVNNVADTFAESQTDHLGLVQTIAHPLLGDLKLVSTPLHLTGSIQGDGRHPPLLGEHTREVLREFDYSDERLDALFASGTVFAAKAADRAAA
jgi:crotonobetainyl-CoA:carnitine CoA-transferase CaiB-like acyl-CoA transferase